MNKNMPIQTAEGYSYDAASSGISEVRASADMVTPLIVERFSPKSIVDFGCGLGDWLASFQKRGLNTYLGIDGAWVPKHRLQIPQNKFFQSELTQPIRLGKKFDIALCLEVAEHLPDDSAGTLLESLVAAADVQVFSAAIPGQGGFKHVNERFQGDWVSRFAEKGFEAFDLIRPHVWTNPAVSLWYRQNILVFANEAAISKYALEARPFIASIVHPDVYSTKIDPRNWALQEIAKHLGWYVKRSMKNRFGRLATKS